MDARSWPTCLSAIVIAAISIATPYQSFAQLPFFEDNAYEFRAVHNIFMGGNDITEPFTLKIASNADYGRFTLRATTGYFLTDEWWVRRIKVDINNDGNWDLDVTEDQAGSAKAATVSHEFPEPAGGKSQEHTIAVWVQVMDWAGDLDEALFTQTITILPRPRVFRNVDGDVFVQVHDAPCTNKVPVLIVEGSDPTNQTYPDTYQMIGFNLINTRLDSSQYEVFILNFHDAARDLRLNADVVLAALDMIHEICPNSQTAIVGLSMGGVVTRYALARAEQLGRPHNVGLFVSYDSPQEGAHVSADLQDKIKLMTGNHDAVELMRYTLKRESSMQMLQYNTYDPAHFPGGPSRSKFEEFYGELNALNVNGYPHQSYNVAISNGNYQHTRVRASVPGVLGYFNVVVNHNTVSLIDIEAGDEDCHPGSVFTDLATRRFGDVFASPWLNVYYEFAIVFNPTYMPTYSSLDLDGHHIDDNTFDYDSWGPSRFDETVVQPTALKHSVMSELSEERVVGWLGRTSTFVVNYALADGGAVSPDTYALTVLRPHAIGMAPKTVTTSDGRVITYVFDRWDDGSTENPRSFFVSRDVAHTVTMKAHLATASSGATWASTQRRVEEAADPLGPTMHAVYESGGDIWHLRNRRGAGWEQERRVSFGNASNPAIATQSFGGGDLIQVDVAWIDNGVVWFRNSNVDNGLTWQPPVQHISGGQGMARDLTLLGPNCAKTGEPGHGSACWPALLWADDGWEPGLPGLAGVWYLKQPQNPGGGGFLVPGTEGIVSRPAATPGDCGSSYIWHSDWELAFIRDEKVYVESFRDPDVENLGTPPTLCAGPDTLSAAGWTATNPTIVANGSDLFVAWEESYAGNRRIALRQRSGGTWSSAAYFTHLAHAPTKPVLGVDPACGRVNLLWECADHIAFVSRPLSGGMWAPLADLGAGRAPSVVGLSISRPAAMWTRGTVAPYSVDVTTSMTDPKPTTDLASDLMMSTEVWLTWTAPGEGVGAAVEYDLRWSQWPIEDWNFEGCARAWEVPAPGTPGNPEGYAITNLQPCTPYWFALKSKDACGAWSPMSNVVAGGTSCWGGGGGGGGFIAAPEGAVALSTGEETGRPTASAVAAAVQTESVGANHGDALAVEMQVEGDSLVWAAYLIDSVAVPLAVGSDSAGIFLQARGEEGWSSWARYVPSAPDGHVGVRSLWKQGRAVFVGQYALEDAWSGGAAGSRAGPGVSRESELATLLPDTVRVSYQRGPSARRSQDWYLLVRSPVGSGPSNGPPVPSRPPLPTVFALRQNRPNPFDRNTTIHFDLPVESSVRLEVFDAQGRLVRTLAGGTYPAGAHAIEWDRRGDDGRRAGAGVYLYRIQAGAFRDQKKMVLLPR